VVFKVVCCTHPKNFPTPTSTKSPSTFHKVGLKATILTYSFTNQIANIVVKEASKLYTKPVKHIRSFPAPNIQHGFLVENILSLCLLFVLFE
jgi:hypothetical protein